MKKLILFVWCAVALVVCPAGKAQQPAGAPEAPIIRDFWKPDAAVWGDGRDVQPPSLKNVPHGFRNDYIIEIPKTGWYELCLAGAGAGFNHDLLVDGELIWQFGATDGSSKAGNLWLKAGKHTFRIRRMGRVGFPLRVFASLELRPANGRPEASILASKTEVDVVRAGEPLRIRVTAGGDGAVASYELLRTDLLQDKPASQSVATIDFPASDEPITKIIEIPSPKEGAFKLIARAGAKMLSGAEFQIGSYAVVDVKNAAVGSGEMELVHDIDCVAQTLDGKPIPEGTFVECNGPTRVTESKAGRYRESHDCTPPYAPVPATAVEEPVCYSGFSYRVSIPHVQEPHLIEVSFPDDARRSVTIPFISLDPKTGEQPKGAAGYSG